MVLKQVLLCVALLGAQAHSSECGTESETASLLQDVNVARVSVSPEADLSADSDTRGESAVIDKAISTEGESNTGNESATDTEDLWPQYGDGYTNCRRFNDDDESVSFRECLDAPVAGVECSLLSSQAMCQLMADTMGHEFYSFRHNPRQVGGYKCVTSESCELNPGRHNDWAVYRALPEERARVRSFSAPPVAYAMMARMHVTIQIGERRAKR